MEKVEYPLPRRFPSFLPVIFFGVLLATALLKAAYSTASSRQLLPDIFAVQKSPDDARLAQGQDDLATILAAAADYLNDLSEKHNLQSLNGLSNDLRAHALNAEKSSLIKSASNALDSRGLLDGIGNLFGGGGAADGASNSSGVLSGLLGSLGNIAIDSLAEPAGFLGDGLGRGTTAGLNMTTNVQTTEPKPSGLNAAADNLGFGLTKSLFGSLNLSSVAPDPNTLGNLASALAVGLGGGAASGLKLNQSAIASPNMTGINLAAKNFGDGLTTSFLGSANLSSIGSSLGGAAGGMDITSMIGPAAQGAGSGLGEGAAVGLGLKQVSSAPSMANASVEMVAKGFTFGLTSSFLANGTLDQLQSKASMLLGNSSSSSGLNLQSISISKAAEGLGRGLVDGAGESLGAVGGVQGLIGGSNTTSAISATTTASTDSFNDTVGGAATGFGRGLGSQGVILVLEMFGKAPSSTNASTVVTRDLVRSIDPPHITKRAAVNASDILADLNMTMVDGFIQKGIDGLTCQGVGGLVAVLLGLRSSGAIASNTTLPKAGTLPNATFIVTNDGNEFVVNTGTFDVKVNGMEVVRFAVVLVLHILLAILIYFIAIPLALILEHSHGISLLIGRPRLAKAPRWTLYIYFAAAPLSLLVFIFGILVIGNGKHFITPHAILGLLALLSTSVASALELPMLSKIAKLKVPRWINLGILLGLGKVLFITGFQDLNRVSLCAVQAIVPTAGWIVLTMALDALGVVAVSVVGVRFLVGRWVGSGDKEKDRESEMFGDVGLAVERGVVKEVKEVKQ